jgi:hypothetical protein
MNEYPDRPQPQPVLCISTGTEPNTGQPPIPIPRWPGGLA